MYKMKICVIGAFFFDTLDTGGQPVKTRLLYHTLCKKYGEENISFVETVGWKKHPISLFRELSKKVKQSDIIIMLPANNGVKIFGPILLHFKKKYGKKIFYDVIGGWLPEFLSDKQKLAEKLKRFDGIWVETSTMKEKLEAQGFENITVIPNFKELKVLEEDELVYPEGSPLRLCTFSRVMKEKGIEDAVNSVKAVNEKLGYTAYHLDIYGAVDAGQTQWFENLKKDFPECIEYKGVAKPEESVEIVKNYFALLFPTYYEGEGFAGTLIDAFSAGVPVIATDWRYNSELVDKSVGITYPTSDSNMLVEILLDASKNPEILNSLKKKCLIKAKAFSPESALSLIEKQL